MSKLLAWLISLVVLILVFILGYFVGWKFLCPKSEPQNNDQPQPVATKPCPDEELATFKGQNVKISFKYPVAWGKAEEKLETPTADNVVKTGKFVQISFTKNPYLTISGASTDFESKGIGSGCPIRQYFSGTGFTYLCADIEETSGTAENCQPVTIDSLKAISYLYIPKPECHVTGINQVIYTKTSDATFPGLVLELEIANFHNTNLENIAERLSSGSAAAIGASQVTYLTNMYNDTINDIKNSLVAKEYKDYLMQKEVEQFEALVETIKFSES